MMPSPFASLTLQGATTALNHRGLDTDAITEALDFYNGEHWRDGAGYIGQVPPLDDLTRATTMMLIETGFVSENTIKEIVDRHAGGVLGREPAWDNVLARPLADDEEPTPDEKTLLELSDAALTVWWDKRKPRTALISAARLALLTGRATLRIYIPRGFLNDALRASRPTLADALDLIRIHVPGVAEDDTFTTAAVTSTGILRDPATEAECGVLSYTERLSNGDTGPEYVETSFLADDARTMIRILGADAEKYASEPLDLGGRLLIYELRREHLITPQVRQNQKALNLAITKMMRNINVAGDAEVTYTNAEPPMTQVVDSSVPGGVRLVPGRLPTGGGSRVFLQGTAIVDENGNTINRMNPALSYRPPVEITTFVGTHDQIYAMMLNQTHQTHALIAGDATASGISREQARADYETDLGMTKAALDDALRWMLETVLALGACIAGTPGQFSGIRIESNVIVDSGPLSPEERKSNRDDHDAGLLSAETAMSRNGVDDVTAEQERITREGEQKMELNARLFNAGQVADVITPTGESPAPEGA